MTPEIAIFARWPEPGKAKTRLIPALGAEGAAKLYAKLLEVTVREARASGLPFHLRVTGDDPARFRDWLGDDDKWRNIAKHSIADFVSPGSLFSWLDNNANEIEAVFHMGASSSTTEKDADNVVSNNFSLSLALSRSLSFFSFQN